MRSNPKDLKTFVGLVSFRRNGDLRKILPPEAEGAVGWQAGKAENEDQFVQFLRCALGEIGLDLIEVEDIQELLSIEQAYELDDHLAHNMEHWEAGKMTVWGTIHIYMGEGEA